MIPNTRERWIYAAIAVVALILILWFFLGRGGAQAAERCTPESTGLKYTQIEGSGFASFIFLIPLVALAPLAGATDTTGQYRCHVAVIGSDAVGAVKKVRSRPKVTPN